MAFTPILGPAVSVGTPGANRLKMAYSPVDDLFGSIWQGTTQSYTVDPDTFVTTPSTRTAIPGLTYPTHSVDCAYATVEDVFLFIYFQQHVSEGKLWGCVGTVSGSTISVGTSSIVYNGIIGTSYSVESATSITYDPVAQKAVSFYLVGSTLYYTVITVSGAMISCGAATSTGITSVIYHDSCYNPFTGKIVLSYGSGASAYAANVIISGSSISISNTTTFSTAFADTISVASCHVSGKSIVMCRASTTTKVFLLGTDMAVLSEQTAITNLTAAANNCLSVCYDPNIKKIVIVVENAPSWRSSSITISGSTFSFKTADVVSDLTIQHGEKPNIVYSDSLEKVIISHRVYYNGSPSTYKYLQVAQLDESAPRSWWTNFSGQSEIIV